MRHLTSQRLHQRQHAPFSSHQPPQPVHISTKIPSQIASPLPDLSTNSHSSSTDTCSTSTSSSNRGVTSTSSNSAASTSNWLPPMPWQQLTAGGLVAAQAVAALAALQLAAAPPSWAVLNSPNARIPRTADAALRRSIPAFNPQMSVVQKKLEDIAFLLRIPQRKPWGNMAADVAAALAAFDNRPQLLAGVPAAQQQAGEQLLDALFAKLKQLELAVKTQQADFVDVRVADALRQVSDLELLEAPGLAFSIPKEYASLPHLVGRATVELTVEKADDSLAFVDRANGGLSKQGKIVITLDGYSAPISAGNFVVNVLDGLYDNKPIQASYASVITAGDAIKQRQPIPLENLPAGTFDPLYRFPLDVQSGELPVLPLSIAGSVSMTHVPGTEQYLSGDEWFIYKFDKQQAGLSGLSFDEGTFGVFGYVTSGMDNVIKLQTGDMIRSAKLTSGKERLVVPPQQEQVAAAAAAALVSAP